MQLKTRFQQMRGLYGGHRGWPRSTTADYVLDVTSQEGGSRDENQAGASCKGKNPDPPASKEDLDSSNLTSAVEASKSSSGQGKEAVSTCSVISDIHC